MTDDQNLDRMIDELRKLTGSVTTLNSTMNKSGGGSGDGSVARNSSAASDALFKLVQSSGTLGQSLYNVATIGVTVAGVFGSMTRQITSGTASMMKALGGSGQQLMNQVSGVLTTGLVGALGGAAVVGLASSADRLFHTYTDLSSVGQRFGGSMLSMAEAAGDAALPLDKFSKMLMANSTAAAVLADSSRQSGVSLGALQKEVRGNLRAFGMLSMPIEEIADLTGKYAETVRRQDAGALRNKDATTKNITQFAKDINAFSEVTGKSRREIAEATMHAMQDVTFAAANVTESQRTAIMRATAFLGSMPGMGNELAEMLTQTVGRGAAYLTDMGKRFAEVGASSLNGIVGALADKAQNGQVSEEDFMSAKEQFDEYYEMSRGTLSRLATMGNASAAQTLKMLQQMRGIDAKRLQEMNEQKNLTGSWGNLSDTWARLSGKFQSSLFKALGIFEKGTGGMTFLDGMVDKWGPIFEALGTGFGTLITTVFSPTLLKWIGDNLLWLGDKLGKITETDVSAMWEKVKTTFEKVWKDMKAIASVIGTVAGKFLAIAKKLHWVSDVPDQEREEEEDRQRTGTTTQPAADGQPPPAAGAATPAGQTPPVAGATPAAGGATTPASATQPGQAAPAQNAAARPSHRTTKYDLDRPDELSDRDYAKLSFEDQMGSLADRGMEEASEQLGAVGRMLAAKHRRVRINQQRKKVDLPSLEDYEKTLRPDQIKQNNLASPATPQNGPAQDAPPTTGPATPVAPRAQAAPTVAAQTAVLQAKADKLRLAMAQEKRDYSTGNDANGDPMIADAAERKKYMDMQIETNNLLRQIQELGQTQAALAAQNNQLQRQGNANTGRVAGGLN